MAKFSVSVEGLEGLRIALRELPGQVQAKTLSGAVAAGARVILEEARRQVRVDTGLLKRMLRATRGVRRSTDAAAFVTVRRLSNKKIAEYKKKTGKAAATNPDDPFYWSILEFGKSTRTAHPFIRPAFAIARMDALEKIKDALRKGIQREARKLAWPKGSK